MPRRLQNTFRQKEKKQSVLGADCWWRGVGEDWDRTIRLSGAEDDGELPAALHGGARLRVQGLQSTSSHPGLHDPGRNRVSSVSCQLSIFPVKVLAGLEWLDEVCRAHSDSWQYILKPYRHWYSRLLDTTTHCPRGETSRGETDTEGTASMATSSRTRSSLWFTILQGFYQWPTQDPTQTGRSFSLRQCRRLIWMANTWCSASWPTWESASLSSRRLRNWAPDRALLARLSSSKIAEKLSKRLPAQNGPSVIFIRFIQVNSNNSDVAKQ